MDYTDVINRINAYLQGNTHTHKPLEIRFSAASLDGYEYIIIKKRTIKRVPHIEIHTGGFDGTLPADEAVSWIVWELADLRVNGFLPVVPAT